MERQEDKQWTIQVNRVDVSKEFGQRAGTKMQQQKGEDDCQRRKTEKVMERDFEQEELKCTKAFVLVGGTMTTCTVSSKKKQAAIRGKRVENNEKVLERNRQIPGGFEQKAMADPDLCDTSVVLRLRAHASHGDNSDETRQKSACDSLQNDEMEVSSADIHTAGKRAFDPSEPSCEILVNQKTVRRVLQERTDLQEVVENLVRAKEIKEEQRGEAMEPVSVMLHHMKVLVWILSDRLAITRRHGTTMHLTKGEDQLFDHWLREDWLIETEKTYEELQEQTFTSRPRCKWCVPKKTRKRKVRNCGAFRKIKVSMSLEDRRIETAFSPTQNNEGT